MAAAEIDYLNMSDEELANMGAPSGVQEVVETPVVDEVVDTPVEAVDDDAESQEDEADEAAEDDGDTSVVEDAEDKGESNPETTKATEVDPATDYKAQLDRLMAPFKANGRDIQVKGVDDAISLMQMGANYNKKMAALKPNLKLMKLLENNGLLSEEKIGFLIDLEKKNPDAINKLIKDSGLDPLEMDADKAGDYKPNSYTVDDREMELDTVLDELQSSPSYNQTLNIVSNKWDGSSKQVIANSPQLLKVINSHVESGIYDLISKEIESERMFGRLEGMSDIEAYRQVGDAIQARGGFNHIGNPNKEVAPTKPVIVQPKPKLVDEDKLREKKRAAGSTKPSGSTQTNSDFNPLSLSDDAFSKLINDKYL